jgi:CMP-N-acetylneuraminic acid synthetase
LESAIISRVVVSTDCKEIQKISEEHGAEAPFLRPSSISCDYSIDIECFQHYLSWLKFAKQEIPDILVHLRPTYPERTVKLLNRCLHTFLKNKNEYSSLRTVVPVEKTPFKMYVIENNVLVPLFPKFKDIIEPYHQVRQKLPQCYVHNGCIDIINTDSIRRGEMAGNKIYPFLMKKEDVLDIDTEEDWTRSIRQGEKKNSPSRKQERNEFRLTEDWESDSGSESPQGLINEKPPGSKTSPPINIPRKEEREKRNKEEIEFEEMVRVGSYPLRKKFGSI